MIRSVERTALSARLANGDVVRVTAYRCAAIVCGCRVYLGRREDNGEPATVAVPCSNDHRAVAVRFNELFTVSLESPRVGTLAIEVVDELLQEAAA